MSAVYLQAENLKKCAAVNHGFFTRKGGVSEGLYASLNTGYASDDVAERVTENRQRILAEMQGKSLVTAKQVHGITAIRVKQPWAVEDAPDADALVTSEPDIALGILTADCVPVLLADADAGVIGAAHAGWKGALMGVVDSVISEMELQGAQRHHIVAAIGPSIAQPSYEVDEAFRGQFIDDHADNARYFLSGRAGHHFFDIKSYVASRLQLAGVESCDVLGEDTCADESHFFSYRRKTQRNEADFGRQLSVIMLTR